jgi:hypothetical protein
MVAAPVRSTAIGEPLYFEEFHFMSRLSISIIAPTYTSVSELRIAKREGKYSGRKLSLTPARATELRRRVADGDSKASRIAPLGEPKIPLVNANCPNYFSGLNFASDSLSSPMRIRRLSYFSRSACDMCR